MGSNPGGELSRWGVIRVGFVLQPYYMYTVEPRYKEVGYNKTVL